MCLLPYILAVACRLLKLGIGTFS